RLVGGPRSVELDFVAPIPCCGSLGEDLHAKPARGLGNLEEMLRALSAVRAVDFGELAAIGCAQAERYVDPALIGDEVDVLSLLEVDFIAVTVASLQRRLYRLLRLELPHL